MGNVFRVINSNGDIEITMYRKANAVFKTNEHNETDNICTYKETINIFNLLQENYELKSQLKGTTHCFDEEEHEKLKKKFEEYKRLGFKHLNDKCNKLENQQKEFIEYLEDEIQQQETVIAENQEKSYFLIYEDKKEDLKLSSQKAYIKRIILEEILQKYKSII